MRLLTFYLWLQVTLGQRGQKIGGKEITSEDFRSDKEALQFKSESIQDRYDVYEDMGNVQLDDLDENTRFIFYRDDPFQRFMKRLFTWLDILTFVMNLNFQQDKFEISLRPDINDIKSVISYEPYSRMQYQIKLLILSKIKSKYKYVYVYTLFERVNEIAIKQQPWKWEQIVEIRKMAKG